MAVFAACLDSSFQIEKVLREKDTADFMPRYLRAQVFRRDYLQILRQTYFGVEQYLRRSYEPLILAYHCLQNLFVPKVYDRTVQAGSQHIEFPESSLGIRDCFDNACPGLVLNFPQLEEVFEYSIILLRAGDQALLLRGLKKGWPTVTCGNEK